MDLHLRIKPVFKQNYFICKMILFLHIHIMGFPGGSGDKESACHAGDLSLIPRWGRAPGEGNGYPLQCSCLENPRDGGAWWADVYGVAQSRTRLKRQQQKQHTMLTYVACIISLNCGKGFKR